MKTPKYKNIDEAKDVQKEQMKEYYQKNKEKIKLRAKLHYEKNKEKHNQQSKNYREANKNKVKELKKINYTINKEKINAKQKQYYKDNREKILINNNQYQKNKRKIDTMYALKMRIRGLMYKAFKRNGYTKNSKSTDILGCSFNEFKLYLESKFESWMTWDNYGKYNGIECYGWDIDHKTPLASATCEDDILKLNHYSNLQPLCSKINRDIKRNNF